MFVQSDASSEDSENKSSVTAASVDEQLSKKCKQQKADENVTSSTCLDAPNDTLKLSESTDSVLINGHLPS